MRNRPLQREQPVITVRGGLLRSFENHVAIIRALGFDTTIKIFRPLFQPTDDPVTILLENIRGYEVEIQQSGGELYNLLRAETSVMFEAKSAAMQVINVAYLAQPAEFDFFFFGDVHGVFGNLDHILTTANRQQPFFIIANGDLTHSGHLAEYHELADILGTSTVPCFTSLGNHDKRALGSRTTYRRLFAPLYYSFSLADTQFIILDSSRKRGLQKFQYRWLERELQVAQAQKKRIFVMLHRPPVCPKYNYLSFSASTNIHRFLSLMAAYRVEMVFSSHIHVLTEFQRKHVQYVVSGGGGGALWQPANVHHFLHVFVTRDGVDVRVIELPTPAANVSQRLKDAIRFNVEFHLQHNKVLKQAMLLRTSLLVRRSIQHRARERWLRR